MNSIRYSRFPKRVSEKLSKNSKKEFKSLCDVWHSDTDYPWSTQDMHASSSNKMEIWICHSNKKYTYESVNILNICRLLVLCLKNSYSKLISRTLQKLVSHLIFTFSILKAKHYNALCFHQANFQSQFSFAPKSERALR